MSQSNVLSNAKGSMLFERVDPSPLLTMCSLCTVCTAFATCPPVLSVWPSLPLPPQAAAQLARRAADDATLRTGVRRFVAGSALRSPPSPRCFDMQPTHSLVLQSARIHRLFSGGILRPPASQRSLLAAHVLLADCAQDLHQLENADNAIIARGTCSPPGTRQRGMPPEGRSGHRAHGAQPLPTPHPGGPGPGPCSRRLPETHSTHQTPYRTLFILTCIGRDWDRTTEFPQAGVSHRQHKRRHFTNALACVKPIAPGFQFPVPSRFFLGCCFSPQHGFTSFSPRFSICLVRCFFTQIQNTVEFPFNKCVDGRVRFPP